MEEVEAGILRVTFELPLGIDHVHCYLLRSSAGGWILVDTGLGSRDPERRWRPVLDALDAPVEQIVVTHMHPDHVGMAGWLTRRYDTRLWMTRLEYLQCRVLAADTGRPIPHARLTAVS